MQICLRVSRAVKKILAWNSTFETEKADVKYRVFTINIPCAVCNAATQCVGRSTRCSSVLAVLGALSYWFVVSLFHAQSSFFADQHDHEPQEQRAFFVQSPVFKLTTLPAMTFGNIH